MIVFPHSKINIGLNIVEKRADGFHSIQSVFYPVGLSDILEVVEGKKAGIELHLSGIKIPGSTEDNLLVKTYKLLCAQMPLPPVKVHLHKIVPTGAGLGGGSSDASFFLKALNERFELGLAWGELHHYARQIGSDCSFFVGNKPAYAEGRGDELESIKVDLGSYHLCIVHPGIHVDTREAFAGVIPKKPQHSLEDLIQTLPVEKWKGAIHNDFEDTVLKKYPAIAAIKEKLYAAGALYASMSGSGSAVYGLFADATDLKKEFPGNFVWEEML